MVCLNYLITLRFVWVCLLFVVALRVYVVLVIYVMVVWVICADCDFLFALVCYALCF